MKECPNCKAQLEDDALFCGVCGTKLGADDAQVEETAVSEEKFCVHCGKAIEIDSVFCPFCGKPQDVEEEQKEESHQESPEQPKQPEQPRQYEEPEKSQECEAEEQPVYEWEEEKKSKTWLWILLALLVAGGIGAWYFLSQDGSSSEGMQDIAGMEDSVAIADEPEEYDSRREFIREMYKDFFENKNFDTEKISNLQKYLSPSVVEKLKMESPYEGEKGEFSYVVDFFRDGSLSYERPDYGDKVVSRKIESEDNDWYLVTNIWDIIKEPVKVHLQVKFVDGAYKIVDFGKYKKENSDVSEVNEDSPSDPFVGNVYKGSGNGGGIYTEMKISFYENHQCTCVSDWYQAFSSPQSIKGNYEVKGKQVIVHCKNNNINYDFKFDVKENGRVIEFNHSDPEMGGTMGNDFMSLEIQ